MESTTVGGTATFLATSANNFGETSDRTAAFESTTTKGGMSINIDTEG
jgi:hypothetical protein